MVVAVKSEPLLLCCWYTADLREMPLQQYTPRASSPFLTALMTWRQSPLGRMAQWTLPVALGGQGSRQRCLALAEMMTALWLCGFEEEKCVACCTFSEVLLAEACVVSAENFTLNTSRGCLKFNIVTDVYVSFGKWVNLQSRLGHWHIETHKPLLWCTKVDFVIVLVRRMW